MSLLSVTVKKARYVGIQPTQYNTYVTLKLQNVKSTTVTVKGPTPCWEQDFLFEINDINLGLLVEVWNKGVIWDRALGYHYLPLTSVAYNEQECGGRWIELEAQLMMRGGAVVGTTGPTGHALMLDCRFEPPFDAEGTGGVDLQRKLDLLNGALDAERAEQARRQMQYIAHSGYSEDSDYTSDLNYPVGQHANCSASQFRNAAHQMHTPQRSLEVSRENSYERDEYHIHGDAEPLYYNSQPRTNRIDTWSQLHAQASVESAISWRTAADWQSAEDQRRPSLERQSTLYDDGMGFGYDPYSTTTQIRDHGTRLSQQASYEEYYDSISNPYQPYGGDDSRQWDSGGRYFYDDGSGLTPTEYENAVNKRRTSVVQLPQVPPKQLPPSSRYSEYNEMAPYRPRPRRSTASLPVTPSSTPKRVRLLPQPPGSETGSTRSGRTRRLPPLPHSAPAPPPAAQTHVPYLTAAPEKLIPDTSYGYDSFGYLTDYQDTATEPYQDTNYNTRYQSSYDEDGMQPFFNETPHATPPAAAAQKATWSEPESTSRFAYPTTSEEESLIPKSAQTTVQHFLPQIPVTQQDVYHDQSQSYQQYDLPYESQQQYDQHEMQYQDQNQYLDQKTDFNYQTQFEQQYQEDQKFLQQQQREQEFQQQQYQQQQYLLHQQPLLQQQHQQQQQQQKLPAQQLQTTVMTGAATLGSLMAGGAKKLGSLFGAAAAAVAPAISQPPQTGQPLAQSHFTAAVAPATQLTSTTTVPIVASVPESLPSAPVSAAITSAPVSLPRAPSLRRQESIQRPPVHRTRTLPDAPEDMPLESAYEDEYQKTEYDRSSLDRTSLDRYRNEEYPHDTIHEDVEKAHIESDVPSPGLQKTASPIRNGSNVRKPSVESYHSQAPSILDRKTSQTSFHYEENLTVPTSQEEPITDKTKVTFKDERTTYHEVPDQPKFNGAHESFDENDGEYHDDEYTDETEKFHDEHEKFRDEHGKYRDEQEKFRDEQEEQEFQETDEQYQVEEQRHEEERLEFKPEQPKLTAKQRWHRAYNKIVMQLNVSLLTYSMIKAKFILMFYHKIELLS